MREDAQEFENVTLEGVIEAARPILADLLESAGGKPVSAAACRVMAELLRRLISDAEHLTKFKDRISPPWLLYDYMNDRLTIDGIKFSHLFFDHLTKSGHYFRVIDRRNGAAVIEQLVGSVGAAAPDLLAALVEAVPALEHAHAMTPGGPKKSLALKHLNDARAAIAKATASLPDHSKSPPSQEHGHA